MLCDSSTWCYVILVWWKQLLGEILRIPEEPRKSECSWHTSSPQISNVRPVTSKRKTGGEFEEVTLPAKTSVKCHFLTATCHDQCSSVPELPLPNTISCISTVLTAPFVLEGTPRSPWHTNLLPEHRRSWAKSLGRLSSGFGPLPSIQPGKTGELRQGKFREESRPGAWWIWKLFQVSVFSCPALCGERERERRLVARLSSSWLTYAYPHTYAHAHSTTLRCKDWSGTKFIYFVMGSRNGIVFL